MHIFKSLIIAFSIYSQIPVPQFEWKDRDMEYMLCFFPLVGVLIAVCVYLWYILCNAFHIGNLAYALVGTAIPILITGGFHIDGFMDTMDAFHSYKAKEEKLKILKDAHIGAFAVIMLVLYGLLYVAAFSEIKDSKILAVISSGFVLSRCLSGIGVVSFQLAKEEGMLHFFATSSRRKLVRLCLAIELLICVFFMLLQSLYAGIAVVLTFLLVFCHYYYKTKKELGGITGDTAGYFVIRSELAMVLVAAVLDSMT